MGAGSGHVRLAPPAADRAADRPGVGGDARALVPAMPAAEAGRGPGRPAGTGPDHDAAEAADARPLARDAGPAAPEAGRHRRAGPWIHSWTDCHPVAPQGVAAVQGASRDPMRWRSPPAARGPSTAPLRQARVPDAPATFILLILPAPCSWCPVASPGARSRLRAPPPGGSGRTRFGAGPATCPSRRRRWPPVPPTGVRLAARQAVPCRRSGSTDVSGSGGG